MSRINLERIFDYEFGEELMAVTADVAALVTRLNALASALPTYVASQVAVAEATAAQDETDNVAALSGAIAPLEATVEPVAPAPVVVT